MADRIVITSQKGGAGKTTVALNLALAFAERGQRTLLVDLDPQGGIGLSLAKGDTEWRGLTDALMGHLSVKEAIVQTHEPNLAILPRGRLDPADVPELERALGSREPLARTLGEADEGFKYVIIDTPSGVGTIPRAALATCGFALVVFKAEPLAMRSIQQVLRAIEHAREVDNAELELLGIVPTMVELQKDYSQSALLALWGGFGGVTDTIIPRSEVFSQASLSGLPVGYLGGRVPPEARRFDQLAAELENNLALMKDRRTTDGTRAQRRLV